jgi:putative heme-binding domain-containing protein
MPTSLSCKRSDWTRPSQWFRRLSPSQYLQSIVQSVGSSRALSKETRRGSTGVTAAASVRVCTALALWLGLAGITRAQPPEDLATEPALEPNAALASFQVREGLAWSLVLSEPTITQPLMTTFDTRGRLWVAEYRQYPNPEGLRPLSRDKHWRVVYDAVPAPPGQGGVAGVDRISVHEDRDADGVMETHHVFVDGLNIATAVAPVEHGAWVLNPPYLLYYHDLDDDLRADGPPEIHLAGFGLEDTHSVVNSLCMGPDGWLYAAQGSTVSASIKAPGSQEKPAQSLGQAIWRYHPLTRRYEIFAEGGGNAFGVAWDDRGEIFSGHNGGDTRGFHYYQGGYYRKGFSKHGSLSNPNSFGYLNPMQHDPIPRFTHTMLWTESTALQHAAPKSMLAVDPLHGKLIQTERVTAGSTYATQDVGPAVSSTDKWFRPVAITDGPDGAAYVCDWYDSVVAHIYAFEGKLDRDRGRVFRLAPAASPGKVPAIHATSVQEPLPGSGLGQATPWNQASPWNSVLAHANDASSLEYLLGCLSHPYRWQRWNARWQIARHPMREQVRRRLEAALLAPEPRDATGVWPLEALWTAHACGWIQDTIPADPNAPTPGMDPAQLLQHPHPDVRAWTVRLVCDDGAVAPGVQQAIARCATLESDLHTLCQIACSAKRLPASDAIAIMQSVLSRPIPVDDPFLPLLCWWTLEHHAEQGEIMQTQWLQSDAIWAQPVARRTVIPNLIRRWSAMGTPTAYRAVADTFRRIGQLDPAWKSEASAASQAAFEQAFVGRSLTGVPDTVVDAMIALGQPPLTLQMRRGDSAALDAAARHIADSSTPETVRVALARLAGELPHARARQDILEALSVAAADARSTTSVRNSVISALASFDSAQVGAMLIAQWAQLPPEVRPATGAALAGRATWTVLWLDACDAKSVEPSEMPPEAIRAMRLHEDEVLQSRLARMYPEFASIDLATANARSAALAQVIMEGSGDPYRGKKLYRELCGRCHQLFDDGGRVGPNLTGYQRDQIGSLLRNILAPSLEIREGYQMVRLLTDEGQVLSGFLESDQPDQLSLRSIDGQLHTIERERVEQLQPQILSLMPEGLLDPLDASQLRDLMAYLRSSQPLNDGS